MTSAQGNLLWLNVDKPVKSLVIHNEDGCWDERKKGRGKYKPVGKLGTVQLGRDGGWLPFQSHSEIREYARKTWPNFPPPYPCSNCLKARPLSDLAEPASSETNDEAEEGARILAKHYRIERNLKVVAKKRSSVLKTTGTLACEVCNFDFHKFYGPYGLEFCEVHHLRPLGELDLGQIARTRLEDLAILCSNCHRMIHRSRPCLDIQELRNHIQTSQPSE